MFISKKRWHELERRVAELEKQPDSEPVTVDKMIDALGSAISNAVYHFNYSLARALSSDLVSRFSIDLTPDHEDHK